MRWATFRYTALLKQAVLVTPAGNGLPDSQVTDTNDPPLVEMRVDGIYCKDKPVYVVRIARDMLDFETSSLLRSVFHHLGPDDFDLVHWFIFGICLDQSHALDHSHTAFDPAENCVLSIQPRGRRKGDEELAAVGVRSTVRHAQNSSPRMLQIVTNLILEFLAVD